MSYKRLTRWVGCLLRLPSFGVALGVSLAVLLAFVIWMFVDASFPATLYVVGVELGLQKHPGFDMPNTFPWDELRSRRLFFAALAGSGALATFLVFYQLLIGRHQSRSLRSLFLAVALVGLWLALGLSHEKLESTGFQWRLRRAVQGLKQDAAILLADWPTSNGMLPYSGPYDVNFSYRQLYFEMNHGLSMSELVWPYVTRADDGGLVFDYFPGRVEYHPNGREPASNPQDHPIPCTIDNFIELEPNWFYVSCSPN